MCDTPQSPERRPDDAVAQSLAGLEAMAGTAEHILAGHLLMLALRAQADLAEAPSDSARDAAIAGAGRVAAVTESFARNPLEPALSLLPEGRALQAQAAAETERCEGRHRPDLWEKTADLWDELGRPYKAAYARWRCAEAALIAKQAGSIAAEHLRAAHEIAARLGARPLLTEIEELARRGRIRLVESSDGEAEQPPAVAPWEHFGLTERELEVVGYLTEGLSNREIAQRLFISPKTAGAHVSNILRKFGVQGRVEAAAIAFRLGIGPTDRADPH